MRTLDAAEVERRRPRTHSAMHAIQTLRRHKTQFAAPQLPILSDLFHFDLNITLPIAKEQISSPIRKFVPLFQTKLIHLHCLP